MIDFRIIALLLLPRLCPTVRSQSTSLSFTQTGIVEAVRARDTN